MVEFMQVRRYSHIMHLESTVQGRVQPEHSALDVVLAAFPAGTLSGAPKVRAMEIIDELERDKRGNARLIFPTRRNLERLALHDSVAAIRADAAAYPIEPITPWVEEQAGERFVTIPGDLGYPVVREKLEGLWGG